MSTRQVIVVVGAGVIGVTTAHALLDEGHEVVLLEAAPAAARGTSQANGGFVSAGFCAPWAMHGLTSGTTSTEPTSGCAALSMVNGALESWVRAAATELPQGWRINVVSPSLVEGTPAAACAAFPGFECVSGTRVALAYLRCLFSGINGQVIRI